MIRLIAAIILITNGCIEVSGQVKTERIRPGDQFPDAELSLVRNDGLKKINLSDLKGKKVIIDLWSKWCTACIDNFPALEEYQREYKKNVVFITVTTTSFEDFKNLRNKSKNIRESNLPFIVDDTLFKRLTQATVVPTYIWLNEDLTLNATTRSYGLNRENIEDFIAGKHLGFDAVKAIELNKKTSLKVDIKHPKIKNDIIYYSSIAKEHKKNVYPVYGRTIEDSYGRIGYEYLDVPLLHLYMSVYGNISKYDVITQNDTLNYITYPPNDELVESWLTRTAFSYQILFNKNSDAIFINELIRKDLEENLKIKTELKDTIRDVLVLQKKTNQIILKTIDSLSELHEEASANSISIKNGKIKTLIEYLNYFQRKNKGQHLPIIDDTNIKYNIDININLIGSSIGDLNKSLVKHGLILVHSKMNRKTLILR